MFKSRNTKWQNKLNVRVVPYCRQATLVCIVVGIKKEGAYGDEIQKTCGATLWQNIFELKRLPLF